MFLPQGSTRSQCCALSSSLDNVRKETDASFLTTWALVGKLRREACMLMAMKRKKVSALLWGFHKTNPSKAGLRAFIVSIKTSSHLLPPAHLYPLIVSDLSRDLQWNCLLGSHSHRNNGWLGRRETGRGCQWEAWREKQIYAKNDHCE